jgi:riboflavin kinase/FMN adenylyltransferase
MKVISKLGAANSHFSKTAIAIGIFDGVHKGHQLLIKSMIAQARSLKAKAGIITFFPHPVHVLRPDISLPYLMSLQHRLCLFKELGVDFVVVIPFNKKFSQIDPVYFIKEILVKNFHAKAIYVGENFRFGKDRKGDINLFRDLSSHLDYRMHAVKTLTYKGEPISSGRLRRLIPKGNLKEAQKLFGRPVSVLGKVVRGSSRGKLLGFPTANVDYQCDALPSLGVYAVRIILPQGKMSPCCKGKVLYGMANLGFRPSFKERELKAHLEVNIFNFNRNIYGQEILVELLKKIRDEQKFSSKDDLIAQIRKDEITIRRFLKVK